ncbi:hypothetical protein VTK26DRAFT_3093 [Humicola hyalothermophila]
MDGPRGSISVSGIGMINPYSSEFANTSQIVDMVDQVLHHVSNAYNRWLRKVHLGLRSQLCRSAEDAAKRGGHFEGREQVSPVLYQRPRNHRGPTVPKTRNQAVLDTVTSGTTRERPCGADRNMVCQWEKHAQEATWAGLEGGVIDHRIRYRFEIRYAAVLTNRTICHGSTSDILSDTASGWV